jgi:Rap1a immunity proteins
MVLGLNTSTEGKMKKLFFVLWFFLMAVGQAYAFSAEELNEDFCSKKKGSLGWNNCMMYILGVTDQAAIDQGRYKNPITYCTPKGVTYSQILSVVSQYIQNNPSQSHRPAVFSVMEALEKAWPCKN